MAKEGPDLPPPGDLLDEGTEPASPAPAGGFFMTAIVILLIPII